MKNLAALAALLILTVLLPGSPTDPNSSGGPKLVVSAPQYGDALAIGSHFTVRWGSSGFNSPVTLVLWRNDVKIGLIAVGIPNSGAYDWTAGAYQNGSVPPGPGYMIRVRATDDSVVGNSGTFSLVMDKSASLQPTQPQINDALPPSLVIVKPAGGETLTAGQSFDVKWDSKYMSGYKLEITLEITAQSTIGPVNGGIVVAKGVAVGDGHFLWKVNDFYNPASHILAGTYPNCTLRLYATRGEKFKQMKSLLFTFVVPAS